MARYGLFIPKDDLFDDLDQLYHKSGATVDDVPDHEATITEALNVLERNGRFRKPAYL